MLFKLDENLGSRPAVFLTSSGHDVSTVSAQNLEGTSDTALIEVCRVEKRCLITLDLDFSNPIQFPPSRFAGIVVLRPLNKATYSEIHGCFSSLLAALPSIQSLSGKLWIVSPRQIREYVPVLD